MNQLISITTNENDEQLVSGRELHKSLEVKTRFSQWVSQNFKGFRENIDFTSVVSTTVVNKPLAFLLFWGAPAFLRCTFFVVGAPLFLVHPYLRIQDLKVFTEIPNSSAISLYFQSF